MIVHDTIMFSKIIFINERYEIVYIDRLVDDI